MSLLDFFSADKKTPKCSVVVVAAGKSERMGSDKILAQLCSMPVIARTLLAFEKSDYVDEIIVVTASSKIETIADVCKKYSVSKASCVISGGSTRTESALAGVSAVKKGASLIAIHDGARPLVTDEIIGNAVNAAAKYRAAVPVIKNTDTVKMIDDRSFITGTLDRDLVVRVQTPQVFDADIIKGALTFAAKKGLQLTDDSMAVELMGFKVITVPGSNDNIKLTTPQDYSLAEQILKNRGEFIENRSWL